MPSNELIWRIAGGSGDGIDSTSQNFAKALMLSGLDVFTHRHYPSRIRGGHTFTEVRAAPEAVRSRGDGYNFLLALGDSFARAQETEEAYYGNEELKPLTENLDDLREGGVIIYDEGVIDIDEVDGFDDRVEKNDWHVYPLNLRSLARDEGREVMRNSAGIGATAALAGMDLDIIEELMRDTMEGEILEQNLTILERAAEEVRDTYEFTHDLQVPEGEHDEKQVLVSGSHAIAYAAIDEGCRFISGYPMTPWTDVFTIMTQLMPEVGGIAEQVEDEIAAATLAIGASHTGVKAMTGSSGGGFALMSESLGMAEMVEEPLVVLEAQRAGPSTGMPTKPEQGDLEHVLYASQGDSDRVVLAPGNLEEAYEQTRLAFQVAHETNTPTIILYDQKLAGEFRNLPMQFFDREPNPEMPATLTETEIDAAPHHASGKYLRYRYDADGGVPPRTVPGQQGGRFLATGNEHNEAGHISEDPDNRRKQVDRRLQKLETVRERLAEEVETLYTTYGPQDAQFGVLTWGTNKGTVEEAVDRLNADESRVKALEVSQLAPFAAEAVEAFLETIDDALVVEMNGSGQFHNHLHRELGSHDYDLSSLRKYDGKPFEPAEIVDGFQTRIDDDARTRSEFNTRIETAAGD